MTDLRQLPPLRRLDDSVHPEINNGGNPTYNPTYGGAYVNLNPYYHNRNIEISIMVFRSFRNQNFDLT
uniref:Uncharacterized protein n=1 Tax=Panagrolaimus sp. PS1159 TaxID=55785 RepID=A0AC35FNX1_9BILA